MSSDSQIKIKVLNKSNYQDNSHIVVTMLKNRNFWGIERKLIMQCKIYFYLFKFVGHIQQSSGTTPGFLFSHHSQIVQETRWDAIDWIQVTTYKAKAYHLCYLSTPTKYIIYQNKGLWTVTYTYIQYIMNLNELLYNTIKVSN